MFWGKITDALVSKVAKTIPRELLSAKQARDRAAETSATTSRS